MKNLSIVLCLAGALAATAPLPAQNTNADAPKAKHSLVFSDGSTIEVSYQQLRLAGGQSLKNLMAKSATGTQFRQYYNTQYLPTTLNGKLRVKQPIIIGKQSLEAGTYGFTFRIDDELVWHFVVNGSDDEEICAIPLDADKDRVTMAKRLVVEPIASSDEEAAGYLDIRYGPLYCKLAFKPGKAAGGEKKAAEAAKTKAKRQDAQK